MKKLLALLLVVCTLICAMTICASAHDRYTQDAVIEWDGFTKGTVKTIVFKPTDITGAVSVKFDLYVGSAADFAFTSFELGTHPNPDVTDWKEKEINSSFGALQDGWNTVTIALDSMGNVSNTPTPPDDGTTGEFDFTNLCRIRMFNVNVDGKTTDVKIRNIVAVKADDTEIKIGSGPAAKEGAPIILDAKNYEEFDNYVAEGDYSKHSGGLYTDNEQYFVLYLPYEGDPASALLKLPAGNGFLISASKDNKEFTEIARSTITQDLTSQDLELDLTDYLGKGVIYVKVEDATPNDGNGAYINGGDKKTEFSVSYQTETPDEPTPATFDAVSSVAVAAVAALGVALVASKKRH